MQRSNNTGGGSHHRQEANGLSFVLSLFLMVMMAIKISKNKENMWVLHVLGWIGAEMLACGLATHFVALEKEL
ncbi:hypothetical protein L1987_84439 [Smallanthus sonchifolius]|uniref:Uncharacterized protein n=1 Tax=Smallanthus sonchifolius TaxID=185202 RepID=A0ACB8YFB5_9ASTR|nr:hypothetical protein L1987_84439 [Smallanthus sonchifolius]